MNSIIIENLEMKKKIEDLKDLKEAMKVRIEEIRKIAGTKK